MWQSDPKDGVTQEIVNLIFGLHKQIANKYNLF